MEMKIAQELNEPSFLEIFVSLGRPTLTEEKPTILFNLLDTTRSEKDTNRALMRARGRLLGS